MIRLSIAWAPFVLSDLLFFTLVHKLAVNEMLVLLCKRRIYQAIDTADNK